jgi:hypothetical protein
MCLEAIAEDTTMRIATLAAMACIVTVAAGPAGAQMPPDRESGRYTFKDVPDGLLRLDTRSGQVSLCNKRTAGWACQSLPDDRAALEDEIARIEKENTLLRSELSSRALPLPDGARREPRVGSRGDQELKVPSDAELDRAMTVLERMWRRLVDMVQRMQNETDGKSSQKM